MEKAEYEARYAANTKLSGRGLDTTMHVPCPFCGAADFIVHRIVDTREALSAGAVCAECKRGARAEFHVRDGGATTTVGLMQTCGDDPPAFLTHIPRVAAPVGHHAGDPRVTTTDGKPATVEGPAPQPIDPTTGQHGAYYVLSAEERAKGFVRPVRRSYRHETCGAVTTMGVALAETYARDPSFYAGTFCVGCRSHFPVGAAGQFVWDGTDAKVGT
jgi:hypothetical protein